MDWFVLIDDYYFPFDMLRVAWSSAKRVAPELNLRIFTTGLDLHKEVWFRDRGVEVTTLKDHPLAEYFETHVDEFSEVYRKNSKGWRQKWRLLLWKSVLPDYIEDDFVLVTDADVLFVAPLGDLPRPDVLAIGQESLEDADIRNSGVMVWNRRIQETAADFREHIKKGWMDGSLRIETPFMKYPYLNYDQAAIHTFYDRMWETLHPRWNFKSYWEKFLPACKPSIIHFHGPTPAHFYDVWVKEDVFGFGDQKVMGFGGSLAKKGYFNSVKLWGRELAKIWQDWSV